MEQATDTPLKKTPLNARHRASGARMVSFGGEHEPWFLNSGKAVAFTLACVFVAGAAGGGLGLPGLAIAAGSFVALTLVLFVKEGGPGTIFPIVMTVGGLFVMGSSALGAWIGTEIRREVRRRR